MLSQYSGWNVHAVDTSRQLRSEWVSLLPCEITETARAKRAIALVAIRTIVERANRGERRYGLDDFEDAGTPIFSDWGRLSYARSLRGHIALVSLVAKLKK